MRDKMTPLLMIMVIVILIGWIAAGSGRLRNAETRAAEAERTAEEFAAQLRACEAGR